MLGHMRFGLESLSRLTVQVFITERIQGLPTVLDGFSTLRTPSLKHLEVLNPNSEYPVFVSGTMLATYLIDHAATICKIKIENTFPFDTRAARSPSTIESPEIARGMREFGEQIRGRVSCDFASFVIRRVEEYPELEKVFPKGTHARREHDCIKLLCNNTPWHSGCHAMESETHADPISVGRWHPMAIAAQESSVNEENGVWDFGRFFIQGEI